MAKILTKIFMEKKQEKKNFCISFIYLCHRAANIIKTRPTSKKATNSAMEEKNT